MSLNSTATFKAKICFNQGKKICLDREVGQLRSADVDGLDSCNPHNKNKWHLPREKNHHTTKGS